MDGPLCLLVDGRSNFNGQGGRLVHATLFYSPLNSSAIKFPKPTHSMWANITKDEDPVQADDAHGHILPISKPTGSQKQCISIMHIKGRTLSNHEASIHLLPSPLQEHAAPKDWNNKRVEWDRWAEDNGAAKIYDCGLPSNVENGFPAPDTAAWVEPRLEEFNSRFLSACLDYGHNDFSSVVDSGNNTRVEKISPFGPNLRLLCKEGRLTEAVNILNNMNQENMQVSSSVYVCLLKGCSNKKSFSMGKQVHAHILKSGLMTDIFVGNSLVSMYFKCGSVIDARQVFDRMPQHNIITWNAMIAGYAKHGFAEEALKLFWEMERLGIKPDKFTYTSILKACATLEDLEKGKQIHERIQKCGFESNIFIGSILVDMYSKCGCISLARQVFDGMPARNVVTWNAMIAGCTQDGDAKGAFQLFRQLKQTDIKPNEITYVCILKACTILRDLEEGKQIHAEIMKRKLDLDVFVASCLIDLYAKCSMIGSARQVFDKINVRDSVLWTTMISTYAQHGHAEEALELFQYMLMEGIRADKVTFLSILKACAKLGDLEKANWIHAHIMKRGFDSDAFVASSLIDMYAKCGRIEYAWHAFEGLPARTLASWNAMIAAYAQHGHAKEAFTLFQQMRMEKVELDKISFLSILKACASPAALEQLKKIHALIIESGFDSDICISTTLTDMYAKCGSIEHAWQVFKKIPEKNVVSWNVMIAGYTQHDLVDEAFKLFWQMEQEGIEQNEVTFVTILKACAAIGALEKGKQINAKIMRSEFESNIRVRSSLVDMYAKCGSLEHAYKLFDETSGRNVVLWNAMIAGYVQNGNDKNALQLIEQMQHEGIKLDSVTYILIISACSHMGLVNDGCTYFESMSRDHGIIPRDDHYACMIDLLGRAGNLDEAAELIIRLPSPPNAIVWSPLLGACKIYGNLELGEHVAECIFKLKPEKKSSFVLLSNIYARYN